MTDRISLPDNNKINLLGDKFNTAIQHEDDISSLEHELLIQIDIAETLGRNFVDAFIINHETQESTLVKRDGRVLPPEERKVNKQYGAIWENYINKYVMPADRNRVQEATKLENVLAGLTDGKDYSVIYRLLDPSHGAYYQALFRNIWISDQKRLAILMAFRCVDDIMSERIAHKVALDDSFSTVKALCYSYRHVAVVDTHSGLYKPVYSLENPEETMLSESHLNWEERVNNTLNRTLPEFAEALRSFFSLETLQERLGNKPYISYQFKESDNTWVEAAFAPSDYTNEGNLRHVIYTVRDITEIKQREIDHQKALLDALEAAEQANQSKSAFLTNMSHDLRTPMNAIISFTALAAEHSDDSQLVSNYLDKIRTSSNHLMSLINDVLDMARLENGKIVLEEAPCSLTDIIYDIHNMVQPSLEKKNLQMAFETKNLNNDYVYGDKLRLSRVLLNLVSNSVKFTEPGGIISVALTQLPTEKENYGAYQLKVKDTGIGMSDDFIARAFEPFEREKTATVSGIQGTGLGLSIAKNIIEMMGGTITVQSTPGKGTVFTITLELRLADNASKEQLHPDQEETFISLPDFTGKHVLLVEDNKLNQEIATILLERFNLDVEPVEDGVEAVEKIKAEGPDAFDLILMDIQMPQMDGYAATKAIRQIKGADSTHLPIVALTANAFEEDHKKALEAGMDAHVSKPVNVEQLVSVLSNCLAEK